MKNIYISLFILLLVSCNTEKEIVFNHPIVYTSIIVEQDNNGILLKGEVYNESDNNNEYVGFCWGDNISFNYNTEYSKEVKYTEDNFSIMISFEAPQNKKIFYRAFTKEGDKMHFGRVESFIFTGTGMKINSVFPNPISIGDTLTIVGKHFGDDPVQVRIKYGDTPYGVIEAKNDTVRAIIPNWLNINEEYTMELNRGGNVVKYSKKLIIIE